MAYKYYNSGSLNIFVTSDDKAMNQNNVDEDPIENKLNKLMNQLLKYAKTIEEQYRKKNIEEEKIKEMSIEWVISTYRFYEINYGDALDSIIEYFDSKINNLESEDKTIGCKIK